MPIVRQMSSGGWPLVVGQVGLVPAGRGARDDGAKIHLTRQTSSPGPAAGKVVTLCGRPAMPMRLDVDVDVFGRARDRLCGSCWRIVECWLEPPEEPAGEDVVVAWLVETVLMGGSAMVDGVPFGRVGPLRVRVRGQIKAAIGGTVTTAMISPTTIWFYSPLVDDAKTEEMQHQEMRDALVGLEAIEAGGVLEPPRWRRSWTQIIGSRTR